MLERGFLKNQSDKKMDHHRIVSTISRTMLLLGVFVLISAFAYLLFNIEKSDMMIGMMLPFLVAGLGLILVSQLIKRAYTRLHR
jgi:ABC-type transport system involved in cytochrome c biogenesis permease component